LAAEPRVAKGRFSRPAGRAIQLRGTTPVYIGIGTIVVIVIIVLVVLLLRRG
jgi:hypothetical protein